MISVRFLSLKFVGMASNNKNEYKNDPFLKNHQRRLRKLDREISDYDRIIKNVTDSYPPRTPSREFDSHSDHRGIYMCYLNKRNLASETKQTAKLAFVNFLRREIEYCENTIEGIVESEAAGESPEEYSEEHRDAYNDAIDRRTSYFELLQKL